MKWKITIQSEEMKDHSWLDTDLDTGDILVLMIKPFSPEAEPATFGSIWGKFLVDEEFIEDLLYEMYTELWNLKEKEDSPLDELK